MSKFMSIDKLEIDRLVYRHGENTRDFSKNTGIPRSSLYLWTKEGRIPIDVYKRLTRTNLPRVDKNGLIVLPVGIGGYYE